MTSTNLHQRNDPRSRGADRAPQFEIGQKVRLWSGFGRHQGLSSDSYEILTILPPRDNAPQYRIRSDNECHERVAAQTSLEPDSRSRPDDSLALIQKTFGHG